MAVDQPIRILFVEDVPADMELAGRVLRKEGLRFTATRVETKDEFLAALDTVQPEIIISDYAMPEFDGLAALKLSLERDAALPFIVLTGSLNEETAVKCIKAGATDYVLKERIARLPFAVKEALGQKAIRLAKEAAERQLRESEARFSTIFHASPISIAITRLSDNRLVDVNEAWQATTGFSRAEAIEGDPLELSSWVDTAERQRLIHQLREQTTVHDFEFQLRHRSGAVRRMLLSAELIELAAEPCMLSMMQDITERKQAEEALRESEERFRSLIEQSSEGVAMLDEQGHIIEWNRAQEQITGIPRTQALGASFGDIQFQILPPERRLGRTPELFRQAMQDSFRTGQSPQFGKPVEIEIQSTTGERKTITQTSFPIKTAKGYRMGGIVRDITEHKLAEEALRESEAKFRDIAEQMVDVLFVTDTHGLITYISPSAARVLGWQSSEIIGRNFVELLPTAGASRAAGDFRAMMEVGKSVEYIDVTMVRKDGSVFSGELSASILRKAEHVAGTIGLIRDITARKQAEKALLESEQQYHSLFDQVPVSLWEEDFSDVRASFQRLREAGVSDFRQYFDTHLDEVIRLASQAKIVDVNRYTLELYAADSKEALLQGFSIVFGPESYEVFKAELVALSEGAKQYQVETVNYTLRGEQRYINLRLSVPTGYEDTLARVLVSITDITERKRAEEALHLQSAALNAAANAIVITDDTRHIQWINPAFTALTGYTAQEAIGHDLRKLLRSGIHDQAFYANHDQAIDSEQSWHGEIVNRRKDGRLYYEEQTITPLRDEHGVLRHTIAVKQDITQRKQRERELEAIAMMATALRAAPDRGEMMPVIIHQVANLLKTDATLLHTVDPATGDAIVTFGQGLGADWTGMRIPRGSGIVGHVIATRRPYLTNDVTHDPRNFRPDLVTGLCAIACTPLIAHDQIIGALWVGRTTVIAEDEVRLLTAISDIAANALQRAQVIETLEQRVIDRTRELAEANQQLAAANERLQELDRLKSRFVSDVSHELRTPITALSLNVELLQYGKPAKREQYMLAIQQQVQRVVRLIDDILNLSRLELGADKVRFGPVALNLLVAQVVTVHQSAADAKNLTLTFTPWPDLPAVRGEESQLAQVITNLVANAINYTRAGEIHIHTEMSDHEVLIEVRDTGLGVAPDDLPHLFERFYRGSRTRDIRGTGLGLAIVKEIVELHGGHIAVDSQVDVGTTFRVYLPIHTA